MSRRLHALAALLAFAPLAGASPEPLHPLDLNQLGAPAFTAFTPRDGVPDSVILSLATDREGFVWLASVSGIARYDGHRWEGVAAPPGIYRDLFLDHSGTLWLTYDDKRPARLEGGRWRLETGSLPTDNVFRILETRDANGNVETWAVTADAGLLRRVNGGWIAEPGNDQLPPGRLHSVVRTREIGGRGRLWVATYNEGLWYREEGDRWTRYRAGAFDPAQVDDLLVTRYRGHEELWVGTYGSGLWRVTNAGAEELKPETDSPGAGMIYTLRSTASNDLDRVVWGASRGGLLRVQGDVMQMFDRRHGLPSNSIRNLHLWKSAGGADVLWLATEAGVARTAFGHAAWRTASLLGSGGNGVFGVLVEPDGHGSERLWVATQTDGVGIYEDGRWRRLGPPESQVPVPGARLIARAADAGGSSLFLGLVNGELLRAHEGTRFERVPTPWPKDAGQVVMDVLSRRVAGVVEIWFATRESGVWRWRGGRFTGFRPSKAVGQWRTVKLAEEVDASGRSWLWLTSNQGLARFDGEEWTLFGGELGIPDVNLIGLTLLPDREGHPVLWAGSYVSGIVRVDVSDPVRPRVLTQGDVPPAPHANAYGAVRDSKGSIYVCTDNGVQLLSPDGQGGFKERVFRRGDGLVHEECNTNAEFVDAHDRYWMGTLSGLAVFDPSAASSSDEDAKPLKLTHVRIDGTERGAGSVHVEPGARDVRVEFALLSWHREAESRFRTQLLGYEAYPTPWGPQSFRVYGALPPGRYVLRVEARDYSGLASAPLDVPVEVVPAWWQRVWFRAAVVAFFVFAGPLFYAHRVRRLSRQTAELETLVASRTSELAAANERLAHLSREDALTGLANRRRLDEALDEEWRRAARLELPLALLLLDVDHFKAYNDHLGHPAGDACLAAIARSVAAANTRAGEVVARYGGEEFAVLIPGVALDAALSSAENVRTRVLELAMPHPESDASRLVTVSVGAASLQPGRDAASPAELVADADRALYAAKTAGRNCARAAVSSRPVPSAESIPYTPPP